MKSEFEPWEVEHTHMWATAAGIAHVAEVIDRDDCGFGYSATFACGFAAGFFHSIRFTTGFYVRTGLKQRRCRKCVAEMRRRTGQQPGVRD